MMTLSLLICLHRVHSLQENIKTFSHHHLKILQKVLIQVLHHLLCHQVNKKSDENIKVLTIMADDVLNTHFLEKSYLKFFYDLNNII